jgi:hypothetical protein
MGAGTAHSVSLRLFSASAVMAIRVAWEVLSGWNKYFCHSEHRVHREKHCE